jgi:hypothetical protein
MQVLMPLLIVLLSLPGLLTFYLLLYAVEPRLRNGLPAPRVRYHEDIDINPMHNDWRGFT